jgi:hypothetical protein
VTAPGQPREPARVPQATRPDDHNGATAARSVWERLSAARSAECPCQAQAGAPCTPSGDHLARYLRAWQAGTLTRESLKHIIEGLDVITPQAIVPAPTGPAPRPQAATAAGRVGATRPARTQVPAGPAARSRPSPNWSPSRREGHADAPRR